MRVRDRSDEFNWLISRIEDYLCFLRNNVLDEDKEELCEKFEIALRSLGDYKLDEDLKLYNENKKNSKSKHYKPTAQEVKELRELTGAGMYDCKKALEYTGDMKKAVEYLRTAPLYRSYHTDYFWR